MQARAIQHQREMSGGLMVIVVTAATALMAMAACLAAGAEAEKRALQIEGSTTVGPIAKAFAAEFMKLYPNLSVTVKETGSGDGAAALIDGRCDIATLSRFMKPAEYQKAIEKGVLPCCHTIALDGVCVIVHPSNPVKGLTRAQIRDIYNGKTTNWKDLGGADQPIVVVSRDTSSGTYEVFNEKVMVKDKMFDKVEYVNSTQAALARVEPTPGAVAYIGIGYVNDKVRPLVVDGITPSRKTVTSGLYPISRPLFLFTNGYPEMGSIAYTFCEFFLTEKGQELIEAAGYVPMTKY
jgi:phosphate transport system substrate-binding protein